MNALSRRLDFLFRSTEGLALVGIGLISLVTFVWGLLSGPMAEWGIRDFVIRALGMVMVESQREARIIMLYHAIAIAVVAVETYFITGLVPMKTHQRSMINSTITVGYIVTLVSGLWFAYFGRNFLFHGLFLFGQSLVFFAGILLVAALWPWQKAYHLPEGSPYARGPGGVDLERLAFFTMAVATLGSALFGAVVGAYWGNGQQTFLAEDLIREPHKSLLQKSIIGHLHIMLTLIAVAITLIVGRWLDFKGILHKWAMPLMILGTIIISLGAWSVVLVAWAHTIIYVGSVLVMLAALFFVIYSWDRQMRDGRRAQEVSQKGFGKRLKALVDDPLKFGVGWQMVYMNFTVSGVGIFMAAKLDEIFRVWPAREERVTLTGHWHILSGIIATIILFYFADLVGLKGKARRWLGWVVILGSDLAFGSVTLFSLKRLFVSESAQQPLVNWTMLLADLGLAAVLVALALFLIWRLYALFRQREPWPVEAAQSSRERQPALPTAEVLR